MSSSASSCNTPNIACEVSLAPIACPRNPGMPNGALRLVKRRADSAAADPAGGLLDAMTELEECVEGVLVDGDGAVATTLLTASGGVESKQASMASPGTSRQPSPTSPPKVQRARVEPPAIALNKAVAEEDADADAARFVAAIMAYAHVSAETVSGNGHRGGDSLREMRAGVETHLLDVVNGAASDENAETCFVPGTVPTSIAENDHESQVALSYKSFPKPSPTEDARGVTTARLDGEATESSLSITKRETDQVVSATHKSLKQKRSTNPGAVAACAFVAAVAVAVGAGLARRLRKEKEDAKDDETEMTVSVSKRLTVVRRKAVRASQVCVRKVVVCANSLVRFTGRVCPESLLIRVRNIARGLPFKRRAFAAETGEAELIGENDEVDEIEETAVAFDTNSEPNTHEETVEDQQVDDDSDPDEAIFAEAQKIGADLIRGLLPTPLMLCGTTKPRWAEGDLSPAVAVPIAFWDAAVDSPSGHISKESPGTPPMDETDTHRVGVDSNRPVDDERAGDAEENESSDELSSGKSETSDDGAGETDDGDYDSDASDDDVSQVSGFGPGMRAVPGATPAFGAVPGAAPTFGAAGRAAGLFQTGFGGTPGSAGPQNFSPSTTYQPFNGTSPEVAVAAHALAQFQQFQQFTQFTQMQQFNQMTQFQSMAQAAQTNQFQATPPAAASPTLKELAKIAMAHNRRGLTGNALARWRNLAKTARREKSAERRERRRSAVREKNSGEKERKKSALKTASAEKENAYVKTRVFEIEQRTAAAALALETRASPSRG